MDVIDITDVPLALVAACITVIAWQDWTQRRIANWAVLLLFGCAALRWATGSPSGSELLFNLLLALMISVPGMLKSALGAGDVKLLFALAPLWTTDVYFQAFSFGLVFLLAACVITDQMKHRLRPATCFSGDLNAQPKATMQQLRERGIPLGTALWLGWLTTLL